MTDGAYIEQRGIRRRIDQQIQVTVFRIATLKYRTEHAGIAGAMALHNPTDRFAVSFKCNRWLHGANVQNECS